MIYSKKNKPRYAKNSTVKPHYVSILTNEITKYKKNELQQYKLKV